jgi:hypothetical protein
MAETPVDKHKLYQQAALEMMQKNGEAAPLPEPIEIVPPPAETPKSIEDINNAAASQLAERRGGIDWRAVGKNVMDTAGNIGKGAAEIGGAALGTGLDWAGKAAGYTFDVGKNLMGDVGKDENGNETFTYNPKIKTSDLLGIAAGANTGGGGLDTKAGQLGAALAAQAGSARDSEAKAAANKTEQAKLAQENKFKEAGLKLEQDKLNQPKPPTIDPIEKALEIERGKKLIKARADMDKFQSTVGGIKEDIKNAITLNKASHNNIGYYGGWLNRLPGESEQDKNTSKFLSIVKQQVLPRLQELKPLSNSDIAYVEKLTGASGSRLDRENSMNELLNWLDRKGEELRAEYVSYGGIIPEQEQSNNNEPSLKYLGSRPK